LQEAIAHVVQAVDEYIADRADDGLDVPAPLTERKYSGKFMVRTSPTLHARLAVEAAEQNVSINHWVVQKLSDRTLRPVISHVPRFRNMPIPQLTVLMWLM
jgi:predicted HicB family RNase H-like nuclease